jgi:L-Ala-D/L-Glu epimerase / N-acetyl-D-glutamate racemase
MSWEVTSEALELSFRDPFRIARSMDSAVAHTVITHLSNDDDRSEGRHGTGEAFAEAYYGETSETVQVVLPLLAELIERYAMDLRGDRKTATKALEVVSAAMDRKIGHNGGAKAGIDIALHDLVGQRLGLPVY